MNLPEVMKVHEVADYFRVNKVTIIRWADKGILPFFRVSTRGDRRFKRKDVLTYVNNLEKEGICQA